MKRKNKRPFYFENNFYLQMYKVNITFVFGDYSRFEKMMKKEYNNQIHRSGGSTTEIVLKDDTTEYILWLPKLDYGALAHEAAHLANFIFRSRGVKVGEEFGGDEHFCFLVEWLVNVYLDDVKYFRKKVRNNESKRSAKNISSKKG